MKRQFTYLVISLVIVVIGVAFYVRFLQKRSEEALLDRIPASKPHQHVSPDGEIVGHTHTYTPLITDTAKTTDAAGADQAQHPILRVWENLDFAAIRRDYQPYTVAEMVKKWDKKYLDLEYPPRGMTARGRLAGQEAYWPKEEWLQQLMDWGHPFREFVHYKLAFDARGIALIYKRRYDNPDERSGVLTGFRLPEDTPWEEVEEFKIKYSIVARLNTLRAEEVDPSTAGGITNIDGVFTPFSPHIVHVHISEDRPLSSFTGMRLTGQQKKDLRMYGIAPKGIHVVYADAEGRPLPAGMPPPRFYERKMEMLAEAEAQLEKLIADHEALFRTLPDPMRDENGTESGEMPRQVEPHRTDVAEPTDTSRPRAQPDRKDRLPTKPLPPPPPDPRKMERWFELLQELHGRELPRDLRGLRDAIDELETIRRTGAEKMRRETTRPDPRTPEEGRISPLPEAQE